METFDRARLVALRERRTLTQRALAIAAGVSETYIQGLENGRKGNPSVVVLGRIADALGVPATELTTASAASRDVSLADLLRDLSDKCRLLETRRVPHRGIVPGEVREHTTEYVEVPTSSIAEEADENVYALELGEALADERLYVGDLVVVVAATGEVREEGGLFCLRVDQTAFVRRAWRIGSHVHVRPDIEGRDVFADSAVTVIGRVKLGGRWRQF